MKNHILETAKTMTRESGLINLSRRGLCTRAGIADGSFAHIMECTFTEFVARLKKLNLADDNHKVIKTRADPGERRKQILFVAVQTAVDIGYNKVTRENIADRAGVSEGLIGHYFSTMPKLKRAVMRYAVQHDVAEIVAQGLTNGDPHAKKASSELKKQAAQIITNL